MQVARGLTRGCQKDVQALGQVGSKGGISGRLGGGQSFGHSLPRALKTAPGEVVQNLFIWLYLQKSQALSRCGEVLELLKYWG